MADITLLPEDLVSRAPGLAQRLFEERMLVITVNDSKLHRLNEAGTFIWQLLETPRTIEDIGREVAGHFDGCSGQQALDDTLRFIGTLLDKDLVVRNSVGITP